MILLDTNLLIAAWNPDDSCHEQALRILVRIRQDVYGPAFITDYVFDEALNVAARYASREDACALGQALLKSYHVAKITETIFDVSWSLFKRAKGLSFTDCTNVIVCQELGISAMATFDKQFKKIKNINVVDEA
ncbi:type II toxin-antitoxin system VapC family toxin [Candidatus Woesearchaeota archaeon]|nr:type II toxin-antitoxin system VapC family toxin [Candidatus Woesearchaeota archaeon]